MREQLPAGGEKLSAFLGGASSAFYGGIIEELLLRWGLLSALAALFTIGKRGLAEDRPRGASSRRRSSRGAQNLLLRIDLRRRTSARPLQARRLDHRADRRLRRRRQCARRLVLRMDAAGAAALEPGDGRARLSATSCLRTRCRFWSAEAANTDRRLPCLTLLSRRSPTRPAARSCGCSASARARSTGDRRCVRALAAGHLPPPRGAPSGRPRLGDARWAERRLHARHDGDARRGAAVPRPRGAERKRQVEERKGTAMKLHKTGSRAARSAI